jgi:mRNA interferase MazF
MVETGNYIPKRGDVVWLNFEPQTGHEQSGRRPAVVLSNTKYNKAVGLAIFCPITSKIKGYPFEVALPFQFPITGVVLSDQVKSLDWKTREAEFIGKLDDLTMEKIIALIGTIIEIG